MTKVNLMMYLALEELRILKKLVNKCRFKGKLRFRKKDIVK